MKKFLLLAFITAGMLFVSCNDYVWIPYPMPDREPAHIHTYETIIDGTGETMYQVIRCSECGEEFSRTPYSGNVITGADGTGYKTIEDAIKTLASSATSAGEYTLTIANGDYAVEAMSINQTIEGKSLTITAETVGGVTMRAKEVNAGAIFTIDSDSSYQENSPIIFKGINFDLTNVTEGNVLAGVRLGTGTNRYAQNITLDSCNFVGLNDLSYAVNVNANAGAKNITIQNCTADNVRGLYGGYGDNIVIRKCTLTNSKSIINSQSVITSMAPEGSYNIQLTDITADVRADVRDKIYAIRISGGRTLIEDCDITMHYYCPDEPTNPDEENNCVDYGLLVLRKASNHVDIKNSTLNAITDSRSPKKAYAIYQEGNYTTTVTTDSSTALDGGVYPETLAIN